MTKMRRRSKRQRIILTTMAVAETIPPTRSVPSPLSLTTRRTRAFVSPSGSCCGSSVGSTSCPFGVPGTIPERGPHGIRRTVVGGVLHGRPALAPPRVHGRVSRAADPVLVRPADGRDAGRLRPRGHGTERPAGGVGKHRLDSWLVLLLLWLVDFSLVTVAEGSGPFYSYGWESQLLETGFLALFLCDLPSLVTVRRDDGTNRWRVTNRWRDDAASSSSVSTAALWLSRWLCFRISVGAGLIKIRGGSCWAERTCLYYATTSRPSRSPRP